MLSISGNNITLTKGDTLTLELALTDANGEAYAPEQGDSIRFAVSTGYLGESYYELHYEQNVPTDTLTFTMPASKTAELAYKEYNYDIELTHNDGCIDTVISGKLKIMGEVK